MLGQMQARDNITVGTGQMHSLKTGLAVSIGFPEVCGQKTKKQIPRFARNDKM
jgi:hypothetical protein